MITGTYCPPLLLRPGLRRAVRIGVPHPDEYSLVGWNLDASVHDEPLGRSLIVTTYGPLTVWTLHPDLLRHVDVTKHALEHFAQAAAPFMPVMTPTIALDPDLEYLWSRALNPVPPEVEAWVAPCPLLTLPLPRAPQAAARLRALASITRALMELHPPRMGTMSPAIEELLGWTGIAPTYLEAVTLPGDTLVPNIQEQLQHANNADHGDLPVFTADLGSAVGRRAAQRYVARVPRAVRLVLDGLEAVATAQSEGQ